MPRKAKRTLREKAAIINYRVPKNYIDNVVEACIASRRDPNELGQVGMMLLINHRFFDFDSRLNEVEQTLGEVDRGLKRLFQLAGGDDREESE